MQHCYACWTVSTRWIFSETKLRCWVNTYLLQLNNNCFVRIEHRINLGSCSCSVLTKRPVLSLFFKYIHLSIDRKLLYFSFFSVPHKQDFYFCVNSYIWFILVAFGMKFFTLHRCDFFIFKGQHMRERSRFMHVDVPVSLRVAVHYQSLQAVTLEVAFRGREH